MEKYIFVTGGVVSSLGKGLSAASLGALIECYGLKVCMVKVDPYLNVDAGTMSPYQHGEVYVTEDGAETDLDLGNYSRFTKSPLTTRNSITTGQVYQEVIRKEREGKFLGKCVQVVPHITDEIKRRITSMSKDQDVVIIEIGGTVGDIESVPFLEAVRQIIHEKGHKNALSLHVTLVPEVTGGELKTKPTQHSVKALREIGIQPDILLCRTKEELPEELRKKIALFTNIDYDSVLTASDVEKTIYEIPLNYEKEGLTELALGKLQIEKPQKIDISPWENVVKKYKEADQKIKIVMAGKYTRLGDTYKSIDESIIHGAMFHGVEVELIKLETEEIEGDRETFLEKLKEADGILVPGGFGDRGVEGMIEVVKFARENKVPYLGICLGMQVMTIEYARNCANIKNANSAEFAPTGEDLVISLLEEQADISQYGGTMRLGVNKSLIEENSHIYRAFGKTVIEQRHRHRYEFNNKYREILQKSGLIIGGTTIDGTLVECVEWQNHPWGVGVQFHPEFISSPLDPNPLFKEFVKAAKEKSK